MKTATREDVHRMISYLIFWCICQPAFVLHFLDLVFVA